MEQSIQTVASEILATAQLVIDAKPEINRLAKDVEVTAPNSGPVGGSSFSLQRG